MIKIAFVCHGNICRSPMAEFVFKNMVTISGLENACHIVSRATSDEEIWRGVGNPIHEGTVEIFNKYNIPYDKSKRAIQLTRDDYEKFDLFIGMDFANVRNMHRIFGSDPDSKIIRLLDLTDEKRDVADPWYTGNFEATWQDINKGCEALIEHITKTVGF